MTQRFTPHQEQDPTMTPNVFTVVQTAAVAAAILVAGVSAFQPPWQPARPLVTPSSEATRRPSTAS